MGQLLRGVSAFVVAGLLLGGTGAEAALVLDQYGSDLVSGGWNTNPRVIQSFAPAADNIAGVSVYVHGSGGPDNDLTVNLYTTYSGGVLSDHIASAFLPDALRGQDHLVTWAPVAVVPEQLYYLEFILTPQPGEFALVIGGNLGDPYTRGAILAGGGNLFGGTVDARFSTFSESTFPEPASVLSLAVLFGLCGRRV